MVSERVDKWSLPELHDSEIVGLEINRERRVLTLHVVNELGGDPRRLRFTRVLGVLMEGFQMQNVVLNAEVFSFQHGDDRIEKLVRRFGPFALHAYRGEDVELFVIEPSIGASVSVLYAAGGFSPE